MTLATESSGGAGRRHGVHRRTEAAERSDREGCRDCGRLAGEQQRRRRSWRRAACLAQLEEAAGGSCGTGEQQRSKRCERRALRQTGRRARIFGKMVPLLFFSKNSRPRPWPLAVAASYRLGKACAKCSKKPGKRWFCWIFSKILRGLPGRLAAVSKSVDF